MASEIGTEDSEHATSGFGDSDNAENGVGKKARGCCGVTWQSRLNPNQVYLASIDENIYYSLTQKTVVTRMYFGHGKLIVSPYHDVNEKDPLLR